MDTLGLGRNLIQKALEKDKEPADVDEVVDACVHEITADHVVQTSRNLLLLRILEKAFMGDTIEFAAAMFAGVEARCRHCGEILDEEDLKEIITRWARDLSGEVLVH